MLSVHSQEDCSLSGEAGISHSHHNIVGIDLPLVHEADLVSSVGHDQEEGVLLAGGKTVGDDVKANSDEGSVITSADVLD